MFLLYHIHFLFPSSFAAFRTSEKNPLLFYLPNKNPLTSKIPAKHPLSPRTSSLPIGVGGSTSMPSGINPLQSETHSNIHSNYAAVEDVAKPAVQPAAETVSSNYL